MKSLLILLVAASFAVHADMIGRQGNDWVRLSDKPCTNELILRQILPERRKDFFAATAFFNGQQYAACWLALQGAAGLVYEDGDTGIVPADELRKAPEA
jgi:hypothetical protein